MIIPWYKKILSYFYLVTIRRIPSAFNPGLCLQMEAGKLLLNTENANYSYGNLHRVFEEVFEILEIEKHPPRKLLLLGLGTGSVIDILQRQYGLDPEVTAVELDPAVIDCLQYWDRLNLSRIRIIQGDALVTVGQLAEKFDLIVIDLFVDMEVLPGIHHAGFIEGICALLDKGGRVLINYIVNTPQQKARFQEFQRLLMNYFKEIKGHEVLGMNRVLELKNDTMA